MFNAREEIGSVDLVWIVLDTLRYDVACTALARDATPNIARYLPNGVWEQRHTPASFTYAAHHAFFAGFLPTPAAPPKTGRHARHFAARFGGSETTTEQTFVFDAPTLPEGLRTAGYHTICVGGVGFFSKRDPLSRVFPELFDESHWSPEMGVTGPQSAERQVECAVAALARQSPAQRIFLYMNISALHQPNCLFTPGATEDSPETQREALAYVDRCLPPLLDSLQERGPAVVMLFSDHGTAYGEEGFEGHRLGHPVVWTVPYAEFRLPAASATV